MGILKSITGKWNRKRGEGITTTDAESQGDTLLKREQIDMHDHLQRERYVKACLEQLAEASKELETLGAEYNLVTSNLTDIEEMDEMAPEIKEQLCGVAKRVADLEKNNEVKKKRKAIMADADYAHMERIAQYMPEGLKKLKEAEEYQALVKSDLGKLEGEKQAFLFRKNELESNQRNMKGMTAICLGSMLFLIVLLSVIGSKFQMDVQIGYVIAVLVAASVLTLVYVKYEESKRELLRVEKAMNKLILLQNTVKIRYVNNTNLLDYLYVKYEVDHSTTLAKLWKKYKDECRQREEEAQVRKELDDAQKTLINILRRCKIQDPYVWLSQVQAIYDNREMVEVRHGLIIRRQKLRKQMEYNAKVAQEAQDEVKSLVDDYPEYAQPILDMVNEYESKIA